MTALLKVTRKNMLLLFQRLFWYILLFAVYHYRSCVAYDPEASITGLYTGPYFDPLTNRNLTAHLGDQAALPCTVRQLGDKSVSWVRMRDSDILTVDRYTFVSDERFKAFYIKPHETWNLVIMYVQERDTGWYECQVSTEPKMSQMFNLRVVVPKVKMVPPGDRYVKTGSEVRIDCHITDVVQHPDYIFWYHNQLRVLDRLDPNLQIKVKETGPETIVSALTINRVQKRQSGNYTCMPSNLHSSSAVLHVLIEEHQAAMQAGRNSGCHSMPICDTLLATVLFVLYLQCTHKFWKSFGILAKGFITPIDNGLQEGKTKEMNLLLSQANQLGSTKVLTECLFDKATHPQTRSLNMSLHECSNVSKENLFLFPEYDTEKISFGESCKLTKVIQLVQQTEGLDQMTHSAHKTSVSPPIMIFPAKNIIRCSQVNLTT